MSELFKTGQPIGFKDINGNQICLGDIVKEIYIDEYDTLKETFHRVEYFENVAAFGFVELNTNADKNTIFFTDYDFCSENFEIVKKG